MSVTRGGTPGENAHMESFFHSLKADVIHGRAFQAVDALRQQLRRYVRYIQLPTAAFVIGLSVAR